jgi:curved DNA-binding protein CbpA
VDEAIDLYKVLQVDPEADPEVIQAAYRRLAQKFHPDVAPGPEAAARMTTINRAWSVLRDPGARTAYDRARGLAVPPPPAPRASSAGSAGSGSPETATPEPGSPGAAPRAARREPPPPPDTVSRDWTSGRSTVGGGYDPRTMGASEGLGAAGPPPGNPSGSVLNFGRYAGWSLGEIARRDVEYLEWLDRVPLGRRYRDEVDALLRKAGRRRSAAPEATDRRGLFRRR